ncbi:hypothetical protein PBY51_000167 [Eleginops maclovinus]|uniref:Uncharacterized protein n=1 Tax=Eleginops maclovinus TaxID=56733 RepID=A0AAN8AQ32_ELEMC|nr:hypothetical protein PBY51_000167 [Eleginops maclovinus]
MVLELKADASFGTKLLSCSLVALHFAGNEPSLLGTVESYNPVKRHWEYVASMPTARCSSALLQTPSIMFVIGGVSQGPSNAVEAAYRKTL